MRGRCKLGVLLFVLLAVAVVASLGSARPLADSVILFIGDGMGPGQVEMARGASGEPLAMDRMPYSGTATTHSASSKVTDSAAAGTALATGHKTNNGMIATSPEDQPLETILERCRKRNKTAGIITKDALWGATPSSFAAHTASRNQKAEIALQVSKCGAKVMLGYWQNEFLPKSAGGNREDGRDLVAEMKEAGYRIVYTRDELSSAQEQGLVGLFDDGPQAPTIGDMVNAALPRLGINASGFFLVVEHARIDWEPGNPSSVLADMLELDQAVGAAVEYAKKRGRTLVLVTGDHETGGLQVDAPARLPTLMAAKGSMWEIAAHLNEGRSNAAEVMAEFAGIKDLTEEELDRLKQAEKPGEVVGAVLSERAGIRWTSDGDHTATPVRVFAFGPGAERFAGAMDNTDIPQRIADILGIGPFPQP